MRRTARALSWLIAGRSPAAGHCLIAPASLWLLVFLVAPLLLVAGFSFAVRGPYGTILWRFSLLNYARVLDPDYLPVLLRSLAYAAATTCLCLGLGYPVAYALSFFARGWRDFLMFLVMLPFWTSCLVSIYSWMIILGREGLLNGLLLRLGLTGSPVQFLNTPFAVLLGLVFFYLPFMILPLYSAVEKIPRPLIEASRDLGAGTATTFLKVTLPLSLPGVAAGSILTFIPCVGDFLTAEFLGGPRTYLLGNLIQNQFLVSQDWPFGAALAAVLLALLLSGLFLYLRLEDPGARNCPSAPPTENSPPRGGGASPTPSPGGRTTIPSEGDLSSHGRAGGAGMTGRRAGRS